MAHSEPKITDADELAAALVESLERASLRPDSAGWMLLKFSCDTLAPERAALVFLLDLEQQGDGIRYTQEGGIGWFWSTKTFVSKYGYAFKVGHPDYQMSALNDWFLMTTDGDWNHVFGLNPVQL